MPRFLPSGFEHGFAERDAGVFDGVVLIDVEIAFGFDVQIESAVARDEIEHVVEEADAGGDCARCRGRRDSGGRRMSVSLVLR